MRHILLAQAVTAASFGMLEAALPTALVAAAGIPHRGSASLFGTAADAITLTLDRRGCRRQPAYGSDRRGTSAQSVPSALPVTPTRYRQGHRDRGILSLHPCPARCGHGIGVNLVVLAGVVPVPFGGLFLPHPEPFCHPRDAPHGRFAAAPRRRWARGRGRVSSRPTGSFRHALCRTTPLSKGPQNPTGVLRKTVTGGAPGASPPDFRAS
jgi:hypothetical protein